MDRTSSQSHRRVQHSPSVCQQTSQREPAFRVLIGHQLHTLRPRHRARPEGPNAAQAPRAALGRKKLLTIVPKEATAVAKGRHDQSPAPRVSGYYENRTIRPLNCRLLKSQKSADVRQSRRRHCKRHYFWVVGGLRMSYRETFITTIKTAAQCYAEV